MDDGRRYQVKVFEIREKNTLYRDVNKVKGVGLEPTPPKCLAP